MPGMLKRFCVLINRTDCEDIRYYLIIDETLSDALGKIWLCFLYSVCDNFRKAKYFKIIFFEFMY